MFSEAGLTVLPGLFGLVGVLLGGVITARVERRRLGHEDRRTSEERLINAIVDYSRAVKSEASFPTRIYRKQMTSDEARAPFLDAERTRSDNFERLLLLASPELISAARKWHYSIWSLGALVLRPEDVDQAKIDAALRSAEEYRRDFHSCARAGLGIDGDVPVNQGDERRDLIHAMDEIVRRGSTND